MTVKYSYSDYSDFLSKFFYKLEKHWKNLIENGELNENKYSRIFKRFDESNKEILNELIDKVFDIDCDFSTLHSMIDNNVVSLDFAIKDLNERIANVYYDINYNYAVDVNYCNSQLRCVLDNLKWFAISKYFTFTDDKIVIRDMSSEDVISSNYDAIMDYNGKIYKAYSDHDHLLVYMIANAVNLTDGIRIAHDVLGAINSFDISSLYKYFSLLDNCKKFKNKYVVLEKSRIRKLCNYFFKCEKNSTKFDLVNLFIDGDGFGYDFLSTSKENKTDKNFSVAFQNLSDISDVLNELFPNEEKIDLVADYKKRLHNMSNGLLL